MGAGMGGGRWTPPSRFLDRSIAHQKPVHGYTTYVSKQLRDFSTEWYIDRERCAYFQFNGAVHNYGLDLDDASFATVRE